MLHRDATCIVSAGVIQARLLFAPARDARKALTVERTPTPPRCATPVAEPAPARGMVAAEGGAAPAPARDVTPRLQRVEFLYTQTPVEGCDLAPYVVIRTAAGEVKSAEAIEAKTRGALSVQYRWNRCAAKYSCARPGCFKPATVQFVPLLKIAAERDLSLEQLNIAIKESFFCSPACLRLAWTALRQFVTKFSSAPLLNGESAKLEPDEAVDAVRSHCVLGKSDGVFQDPLENPTEVSEVGWIRNYAPTADDVGHVLELVCRYVHRQQDGSVSIGPPLSARSQAVMRSPDPPPERHMLSLNSSEVFSTKTRRPDTFRVLSYNVLAEIYANSQAFPNCPSWALAWTYRRRNLIREIAEFEADILCLQEVQADHYEDHFEPFFARLGYEGCFKVKTRESMGRKGKIDGCATFFRKDMFVLRELHSVEYNGIAHTRTKASRTLNRCLKGNVGLILVLDMVDGSGPIVIANTHLFWDPDLTDVKLFQVDAFLQELEVVLQTHRFGLEVPVIIGGDFNSEPASSVYELLTTGACSMTRDDVPDDSYGVLSSCRLQHNLHLRSSYSQSGSEPAFTNYTHNFVGVLDYIWYSVQNIVPTAVIEIPDERSLFDSGIEDDSSDGIPSSRWSSDHVALMTEFQLLKPRHGGM